jgi:hypothetical protein
MNFYINKNVIKYFCLVICVAFFSSFLSAQTLIITKGGTYSGTWQSNDSRVPAVQVNTSEPVVIQNSTIKSAGHLIYSSSRNCNLTVKNTSGYGLTPYN